MRNFQYDCYHRHLSDETLQKLAQNRFHPEISARLDIAEHLSCCTRCLKRYADYLTADILLTPKRSCQNTLWRRLCRRYIARWLTAAAVVTLALTLLWGDAGTALAVRSSENCPEICRSEVRLSNIYQKALNTASDGLQILVQNYAAVFGL